MVLPGGKTVADGDLLHPPAFSVGRTSTAQKRCLELSGARDSSVYWVGRVPDTFFWAKPLSYICALLKHLAFASNAFSLFLVRPAGAQAGPMALNFQALLYKMHDKIASSRS